MSAKPEIRTVLMSSKGQIGVFDPDGNQITELQEPLLCAWASSAEAKGHNVDGLIVECVSSGSTVKVKLFKTDLGYYNFNILGSTPNIDCVKQWQNSIDTAKKLEEAVENLPQSIKS